MGGGICCGDTPRSTIIRECAEEASLDPTLVARAIRSAGVLTLSNRSPSGWLLPGLYYLYDLPLPSNNSVRPATNEEDGEVESFELMAAQEVLENLVAGEFKSSSALALVDFMIRHGLVTEETDSRYAEICLELRRELVLPIPW